MVGRYVLLYQLDASSVIRSLLRSVKRSGIVVFHEFDLPGAESSYPPCPLYDQVGMLVGEVFRRGGAPPCGRRLGKTLLDAGLPFPTIAAEIIIGGGAGSYVYPWLANTLISVAPRLAQLGLSLPPDVAADHTLAGRMRKRQFASAASFSRQHNLALGLASPSTIEMRVRRVRFTSQKRTCQRRA